MVIFLLLVIAVFLLKVNGQWLLEKGLTAEVAQQRQEDLLQQQRQEELKNAKNVDSGTIIVTGYVEDSFISMATPIPTAIAKCATPKPRTSSPTTLYVISTTSEPTVRPTIPPSPEPITSSPTSKQPTTPPTVTAMAATPATGTLKLGFSKPTLLQTSYPTRRPSHPPSTLMTSPIPSNPPSTARVTPVPSPPVSTKKSTATRYAAKPSYCKTNACPLSSSTHRKSNTHAVKPFYCKTDTCPLSSSIQQKSITYSLHPPPSLLLKNLLLWHQLCHLQMLQHQNQHIDQHQAQQGHHHQQEVHILSFGPQQGTQH